MQDTEGEQPSIDREIEEAEVDNDLDVALEGIFFDQKEPSTTSVQASADDVSATRQLFADIASGHSTPIKDFIFELRHGSAPRYWIDVCRPVLESLIDAAGSMELEGLVARLRELDRELASAQKAKTSALSQTNADKILAVYERLAKMHPDAFSIDEEGRRQESIIVHSLLRQIPDVGYVTMQKLYRVGLTSRETLYQANPRDLFQTAGVPLEKAERICEWLKTYRETAETGSRDDRQARHLTRLMELVPELRRQHDAFQKACNEVAVEPALASKKREARKAREACALEIEVALAEIGEANLAMETQRLSYEKRLEVLESYMASLTKTDEQGAATATNAPAAQD